MAPHNEGVDTENNISSSGAILQTENETELERKK